MTKQNVFKRVFAAGEASRITGVNYPKIDYWATSSFFRPSRVETAGKSNCRGYTFSDLVAMAVVHKLISMGSGTRELVQVARYLRKLDYEYPLSGDYLLVKDNYNPSIKGPRDLMEALEKPAESYLVVQLTRVVKEVEKLARKSKLPTGGKAKALAVG